MSSPLPEIPDPGPQAPWPDRMRYIEAVHQREMLLATRRQADAGEEMARVLQGNESALTAFEARAHVVVTALLASLSDADGAVTAVQARIDAAAQLLGPREPGA